MARKCHTCEFCKTMADEKNGKERLFTMICTRDRNEGEVIDSYTGHIDRRTWESLECVKE